MYRRVNNDVDIRDMVRDKSDDGDGAGAGASYAKENNPGMFSDDESDSDAVCSSGTDRDDSFGGGGMDTTTITAIINNSQNEGSDAGTWAGANGDTGKPSAGNALFEESGGFRRRHPADGSPMRAADEGTESPPDLTARSCKADPRGAAAVTVAEEPVATVPAAGAGPSWSVLVEKCYVMISCHRNHPLMFKVRVS